MKILLKGYYGFGNLGDDILMKVTWEIVKKKYPTASYYIHSNFNENLKGFSQSPGYNNYIHSILDPNVTLVDWTVVDNFDLVVDGGGGVYFDYGHGSTVRSIANLFSRWIGARNVYRLDNTLRTLSTRKRNITFEKRVGIGLGIGPYTADSALFYQHLAEIGSTKAFFVRDKTSLALLEEYGFDGSKFLCSDLAFYSDYWLGPPLSKVQQDYQGNIGIILLDWHAGNENRFLEVKDFANKIVASGNKVTFFSFDENHDKAYIEEFENTFDFVTWRPNKVLLSDFLKKLGSQDILFSARAHGVIIGSILGVPSICLGTSKKLEEVSKMFPNSSLLLAEPITSAKLLHTLDRMTSSYRVVKEHLLEDIKQNRALARDTLATFNTFL